MPCERATAVGCATVGKPIWPLQQAFVQLIPRPRAERDEGQFAPTVSHELGHVLGLAHNTRRCSLMNSTSSCRYESVSRLTTEPCPYQGVPGFDPQQWCEVSSVERFMCGPTNEDLAEAIALYGGRARRDHDPACVRTHQGREWLGWCAFPAWTPPGATRPAWIERRGGRLRCGRGTPQRYRDEFASTRLTLQALQQIPERRARATAMLAQLARIAPLASETSAAQRARARATERRRCEALSANAGRGEVDASSPAAEVFLRRATTCDLLLRHRDR